jgi:hypothetical protein
LTPDWIDVFHQSFLTAPADDIGVVVLLTVFRLSRGRHVNRFALGTVDQFTEAALRFDRGHGNHDEIPKKAGMANVGFYPVTGCSPPFPS